jgi:hypothetical protein
VQTQGGYRLHYQVPSRIGGALGLGFVLAVRVTRVSSKRHDTLAGDVLPFTVRVPFIRIFLPGSGSGLCGLAMEESEESKELQADSNKPDERKAIEAKKGFIEKTIPGTRYRARNTP